jgi:hypothetical protein
MSEKLAKELAPVSITSSSRVLECDVSVVVARVLDWSTRDFRGSNLEGGLKGFENVVKRTSNGAYRSPRCPAVTKHPMPPGGSSIISL